MSPERRYPAYAAGLGVALALVWALSGDSMFDGTAGSLLPLDIAVACMGIAGMIALQRWLRPAREAVIWGALVLVATFFAALGLGYVGYNLLNPPVD